MPVSNSANAKRLDLIAGSEDTFFRYFRFWDDEEKTEETDVSLNTYLIQVFDMSCGVSGATVIEAEIGDGIEITDTNELYWLVTDTVIKALPDGDHEWKMIQTDPDGIVTKLFYGVFRKEVQVS